MNALPELFADLPRPLAAFGLDLSLADLYDLESPWTLFDDPLDFILEHIPDGITIGAGCDIGNSVYLEGPLFIGDNVRIRPGAVILGPAIIGNNSRIGAGALVRDGCWIGDGVNIGHGSEVNRSYLFDGARAPHRNYVGNSVLGRGVNLGNGTALSNYRNDGDSGGMITLGGVATGRNKLGAFIGDHAMLGCFTVTGPGCAVGARTEVYAGAVLRGVYEADRIIKLRQVHEIVERRR